jgi:hypothetical protein
MRGKAHEENDVLAQRGLDGDHSIFLRIWHVPHAPSLRTVAYRRMLFPNQKPWSSWCGYCSTELSGTFKR